MNKIPLLVLAGGFGTRLHSVLNGFPKALAPVCGKPFLSLQIENWMAQGCTSFIFLLHHQSSLIENFLTSESRRLLRGCQVKCVVESNPMGTGGAVAHALQRLSFSGDFLLTNADTWLGSGVAEMMKSGFPSISVVKVGDVGRYGRVIFNEKNLITEFIEKSVDSNFGWINAGLAHLNSTFFDGWAGNSFSLEEVIYPRLVKKNLLKAVPLKTDFIDIGIPQDYAQFCRWIQSDKVAKL